MSTCLSEFALDHLVLSDQSSVSEEAVAHVSTCDACRHRHDERRAFVEQFEQQQGPRLWQEIRLRHERRQRRRRMVVLGLPTFLAAACLVGVLVVRTGDAPQAHYLGAKGAPSVAIHCRRDGRTFALGPDEAVRSGDELRFVPRPTSPRARYVQIGSIDGTGRYTPFYPADLAASSLPLPAAGEALPGSIRIDGAPGPERLFVVVSAVPLSAADVEPAARERVAALRAADDIAGVEVESQWIVLAKASHPEDGQ